MRSTSEVTFDSMGSTAHVIVVGEASFNCGQTLDWIVKRLAQLESRWSRFLDHSEVSELNRRSGARLLVSADTALLVERGVAAWRLTDGLVDPTVLGAVISAGYGRPFALMGTPAQASSMRRRAVIQACDRIEVSGRMVRLPLGSGFDPGGIGKGLAADLVAREVMASGAAGVCINLGGDLRVAGIAPGGAGWTVAIGQSPLDRSGSPVAMLGLEGGAVATSTTLRRRWFVDGDERHHLIDPRTGQPSDSDLVTVTVVAATAWEAEVLAKATLLTGSQRCFELFSPEGADAMAVAGDGRVLCTPGFRAFLAEDAPAMVPS